MPDDEKKPLPPELQSSESDPVEPVEALAAPDDLEPGEAPGRGRPRTADPRVMIRLGPDEFSQSDDPSDPIIPRRVLRRDGIMVNLPIYDTEHRCKCCGFRFERVLAKQTYCSDCAGVIHANRQMAQWWQEAKATLRKNHENDLPDEPDRPTPYRIGAFGTCRCSPREMLALRLLAYLTPYPMVAVITGISIARCVDFERGYDKTVKNSMDAIQFHLTQNRRLQLMELLRRLKRQLEKGDKVPPDVRIKLDAEYYKYLAELYDLGPEPPSEGTADQAELNRLEIPEDIATAAESLVDSFVRSQTNGPKL